MAIIFKQMKTINIFDTERMKFLGVTYNPEQAVKKYQKLGYSVCVDQDGDICVCKDEDDQGLTYEEMTKKVRP